MCPSCTPRGKISILQVCLLSPTSQPTYSPTPSQVRVKAGGLWLGEDKILLTCPHPNYFCRFPAFLKKTFHSNQSWGQPKANTGKGSASGSTADRTAGALGQQAGRQGSRKLHQQWARGADEGSVSEPLSEATQCHTLAIYKHPSTALLGRNTIHAVYKI